MMETYIIGSGGMAQEVAQLIDDINDYSDINIYKLVGFIDKGILGTKIYNNYSIVGDDEFIMDIDYNINIIIAIGNPLIRRKVYEKFKLNEHIYFPIIIHPSVNIKGIKSIGEGSIIQRNTTLTTNITIGKCVFINIGCVVGHNDIIDDFCSIMPNVAIAGNVHIKQSTLIGIGSSIIEHTTIEANNIIGAGSVIIKDTIPNCTIVGVPGKIIKRNY